MNHKQKYFYTALGAVIMLIGIGIGAIVSPITAQSNRTFGEIQCAGLTVVDKEGRKLIELKNDGFDGAAINLYNLSGQEMMKLKVNHIQRVIRLYSKSLLHPKIFDDSETPILGIHLDAGPSSNYLEVGNTVRRGGIRLYNLVEVSSELQVYHRNGQGGVVLHSAENGHSLSIYDNPDQRKIASVNARMSTDEYGGRVDVFNKQGKNHAVMGINEYGNGAVSTRDKNGYHLR